MNKDRIDLNGKTILITGAAGFIGSNLAMRVLRDFDDVMVVRQLPKESYTQILKRKSEA